MSAPAQKPPSNETGASAAGCAASGPSYDETMAWLKEKIESHAGSDLKPVEVATPSAASWVSPCGNHGLTLI